MKQKIAIFRFLSQTLPPIETNDDMNINTDSFTFKILQVENQF